VRVEAINFRSFLHYVQQQKLQNHVYMCMYGSCFGMQNDSALHEYNYPTSS